MSEKKAIIFLRIITGLLLAAHGSIRLYAGTVNDFGNFLNSKGFLIGSYIAWFLTFFEIAGGLLMAAGYLKRWIPFIFVAELLMGIILVHAANGWFVVGYQSGGVEYNVLLIASLLVVGLTARDR